MFDQDENYTPPFTANEILPNFYLGNKRDAKNFEELQKRNITHIINVADDVPNYYPQHLIYLNLSVRDFGMDEGISRVFLQAFDFFEENYNQNKGILIHCAAGMNRSVTVCIAIVMLKNQINLRDALNLVINLRRSTCILPDNKRELIKFEKLIRDNNSITEDEFYKQSRGIY